MPKFRKQPLTPANERKPPTRPPQRKTPKFGIDLTKCPAGFLPEATNTMTFTARIYRCDPGGGWVFPGPARRITFTLVDVSHELGICLNKGRSRNPDLWFPTSNDLNEANDGTVDRNCERTILGTPNPPHRHFLKVTTRQRVTEFTVTVRSEDFGSFGFIEASAPDCVAIPPREVGAPVACPAPDCCTGSNRVKIPRDDNGNNIADVAAQDNGGNPPNIDIDTTPVGDGFFGDGLSNYEEYRGFFVLDGRNEIHQRTSIDDKDIFIFDRDNQGVGYFAASGLTIHFVRRDHLGGPTGREINFNRGFATTGAQHGVRLVSENLRAGLLGRCFGGDRKSVV